jgi:hypothetical protein
MSIFEHEQFLKEVENYVRLNPDVTPHIGIYAQRGLELRLKEEAELRHNLECIITALSARRFGGYEKDLLKSKLTAIKNRTSLCFDSLLKRLG